MLLARNEIQFEYNDNPISFHIRHKHENVMVLENKESIHQVFFSKDQKGQTLLSTNGFSFTLNTSDNLQSYNFSYAFEDDSSDKKVTAPMHGSVVKLLCQQQDEVQKGQKLIVVEAMKMENTLVAPMNGKVVKIMVKEGQQVEKDQLLIEIV
jgi:3-methylcrotonyl-CoA carboxylase alpha subunit